MLPNSVEALFRTLLELVPERDSRLFVRTHVRSAESTEFPFQHYR